MAQPSAISAGSMQLPKYQILLELGAGGMGQVHLAMSRGPSGFVKLVVLKTLREELRGNESTYRMFLEEARVSARLSHPNLVQTYEVLELDGTPTMVLEYVEGQSLAAIQLRRKRQFGHDLHLTILTEVLAGLHAAHEMRDFDGSPLNLVHRDVSPQNVMLQYDGQVKVLDFGIAKTQRSRVATETGVLKGKIRYMAPEQLAGDDIDRRADVFAVGILLWEALTGDKLWGDMADGDVMRALLTDRVPRLPTDGSVPPELVEICHRAIAVAPEQRYATAGEFRRDLEEYLTSHGLLRSSEELGDFLATHFDAERQQTQRIIKDHIQIAQDSVRPLARSGSEDATARSGAVKTSAAQHERDRVRSARVLKAVVLTLMTATLLTLGAGVWWFRNPSRGVSSVAAGVAEAPKCPANSKLCGAECVALDRAELGCGNVGCLQCQPPNATPRCNQHNGCDIAVCYQAFDNCDGDAANGCETNVRVDPDNCGGCGRRCPDLPNAQRGCGDVCTIWRCNAGYRDCNGAVADGCEVAVLRDRRNCGHCGQVCPASASCREGKCRP